MASRQAFQARCQLAVLLFGSCTSQLIASSGEPTTMRIRLSPSTRGFFHRCTIITVLRPWGSTSPRGRRHTIPTQGKTREPRDERVRWIYQTSHRRTLGNGPLCQRWASKADNGRGEKPKVFPTEIEALRRSIAICQPISGNYRRDGMRVEAKSTADALFKLVFRKDTKIEVDRRRAARGTI
jgi:hypothetical protein